MTRATLVRSAVLMVVGGTLAMAEVNPRDYGAKGDGTTDDTAAIQQALDAAAKAGGQVLLPPGRYVVAGSLRIPPGVSLHGALDSPVWMSTTRSCSQ